MTGRQLCHFDRGFELNGFARAANIWETALAGLSAKPGYQKKLLADGLTRWLLETRDHWPPPQCFPFGELGEVWRRHFKDNDRWASRIVVDLNKPKEMRLSRTCDIFRFVLPIKITSQIGSGLLGAMTFQREDE